MCICETENKPSSESDCSCGHQVRACTDSQHPATALNNAAEWRSIAHHVQTKLVHCFLPGARGESPGNSVPDWLHEASLQEAEPYMHPLTHNVLHGRILVRILFYWWRICKWFILGDVISVSYFKIKRFCCITGICTFSPAVWADLNGVRVIVCSVWVESYTIQWMQAFFLHLCLTDAAICSV